MSDATKLPSALPVPRDDGAAEHLPGLRMPPIALATTDGSRMRVDRVPRGAERLVLYAYPRTGRPGEAPPAPNWDMIPGARGCTAESCAFRDHAADLRAAGASVAGLSTQGSDFQREVAERLQLPFPLLSDADLALTHALALPRFTVAGQILLKRLTLVVRGGLIEHLVYPVFPAETHAARVLEWLRANPIERRGRSRGRADARVEPPSDSPGETATSRKEGRESL